MVMKFSFWFILASLEFISDLGWLLMEPWFYPPTSAFAKSMALGFLVIYAALPTAGVWRLLTKRRLSFEWESLSGALRVAYIVRLALVVYHTLLVCLFPTDDLFIPWAVVHFINSFSTAASARFHSDQDDEDEGSEKKMKLRNEDLKVLEFMQKV